MKARYVVTFGVFLTARHVYFTEYHADQFCRALLLRGIPYRFEVLV